jgi:hypothetical protein
MSTPIVRPGNARQHGPYVTRFAHQLSVRTGTTVQSRWNPHADWQLVWVDGPTIALMRYVAAGLAGSVAGVEIGALDWHRTISTRAMALAMIRNVRRGLQPLGHSADCNGLSAELDGFDHPQRASAAEIRSADRLVRLGHRNEPEMACYLTRFGLGALDDDPRPDNVLLLPTRPHALRPAAGQRHNA